MISHMRHGTLTQNCSIVSDTFYHISFVQVPELAPVAPTTTAKGGQWAATPFEIDRRRNFAIISHPDAGKTTLTEKLLLYGGAIQEVREKQYVRLTLEDEASDVVHWIIALSCRVHLFTPELETRMFPSRLFL